MLTSSPPPPCIFSKFSFDFQYQYQFQIFKFIFYSNNYSLIERICTRNANKRRERERRTMKAQTTNPFSNIYRERGRTLETTNGPVLG
jgi:hypothetical protein